MLTLFPIMLYFYYRGYSTSQSKRKDNFLYKLFIITSTIFLLISGFINEFNESILLINIPLLFIYIKNKRNFGVLFSLILLIYLYVFKPVYMPIVMIQCVLLYFLFFIKEKLNIPIFGIITIYFFITIQYYFQSNKTELFNLHEKFNIRYFLIINICTYVYAIFTILIFKKADKLKKLYYESLENKKRANVNISISKITHEVKNPLVVVKGYIDILKKTNNSKEIEIIDKELKRALSILDDFSSLTKIKIRKKQQKIDLLINNILMETNDLFLESNVKIIKDIDENLYAFFDEKRIKQVIINLLKNSVEALSKKNDKIIEVKLKKVKNHIEIIIKDNGNGVKKNELENIGKPLYTTKNNGTGLGVALSKEIIESHGGKLKYKSKYKKYMEAKITIKK